MALLTLVPFSFLSEHLNILSSLTVRILPVCLQYCYCHRDRATQTPAWEWNWCPMVSAAPHGRRARPAPPVLLCVSAALLRLLSPGCSQGRSSVSAAYITVCYLSPLFPLRSLTWLYFWLLYIVAANKGSVFCFGFFSFPTETTQIHPSRHEQVIFAVCLAASGISPQTVEKEKGRKKKKSSKS